MGMNAFKSESELPIVFASSFWLRDYDLIQNESNSVLEEWWGEQLDRSFLPIEPLMDISQGDWTDRFYSDGEWIIWEHFIQEGRFFLRTGCILPKDSDSAVQFCAAVLAQVQKRNSLELRKIKRDFESHAQTARHGFVYAELLRDYANWSEMDRVYQKLSYRDDEYRWEAIFRRLQLRQEQPQLFSWSKDQDWMRKLQQTLPIHQTETMILGAEYAKDWAQCHWIRSSILRWQTLEQEIPPSVLLAEEECLKGIGE